MTDCHASALHPFWRVPGNRIGASDAFASKANVEGCLPAVAAVHERGAAALAVHSRRQVPLAPMALRCARLLPPPYASGTAVDGLHTDDAVSPRPRLRPDPWHDGVAA